MDIKIGTPIIAENGTAGRVERIIIHPATSEVAGLVATLGGMLPHSVVVPARQVLAADGKAVWITGTAEEINELEPFASSQYVDPPEDWLPPTDSAGGIYLFPATPYAVGAFERPVSQPAPAAHVGGDLPDGDVGVGGATPVICTDGAAGHLDRVVTYDDGDRLSYLVVRRGGVMGEGVVVPMDRVATMGEDAIVLTLARDELDDLPDIDDK